MNSPSVRPDTYPRRDATLAQELSDGQVRLLDAAAAAFSERGYDAASVDDIAREVGVTKGAVYYAYRSKIELFLAVYERGMLLLEEAVATALAEPAGATGLDRLRAVAVGHAGNIMRNLDFHVAVQQGVEHRRQMPLRDRDRVRLEDLDTMRDRHEHLVRRLFDEGIGDGSVRPVPVGLATRTVIGGVVGLAIWYRPRADESDADRSLLAEQLVDILLAGVSTR